MLCLGKVHQHPESNEAWKKRIEWIINEKSYRDYDGINGEPTEFEWNIFPGFTTLQLCGKINDLLSDLGQTPESLTGRILFMSMFNDISCDRKGNEEECIWQQYIQQVESLSLENKVSKFCMDAGFVHVVEVGQYFVTKDTGDFRQFRSVLVVNTLFQEMMDHHNQKGWIQGNTKIGPVLEITTSCVYGKHGIEIRIWSLRKDSSHSWVRISHGSNKFVIDSNYNNTEVPANLPEE